MKLRQVATKDERRVELLAPQGWVAVRLAVAGQPELKDIDPADVIALLALPPEVRAKLLEAARDVAPTEGNVRLALPFAPRSFRDFMLYEIHAIDAARGFVRRFMPGAARIVGAFESITGRTFPSLKPHALWYRQPVYYFGNHLTFAGDGHDISIPRYTRALDYELELGFVLVHPLRDATPAEAERAIGGFVVLNDFSARDVQLSEMRSGFGPQKSKHFCNTMSAVVVSADEILPRWRDLKGRVSLNGKVVAECATAGARFSLGEVLAHASRGEQLYPGELFGSGTLPGGSGIETGRLLTHGDAITLTIDGVGTLANRIV
jgi:2-keto-4-pentenoate hydratase/2-oxohepta-3-ene-1,7-dioic acid hydratase in catechol pathway